MPGSGSSAASCEIDPELAALEAREPVQDAKTALSQGEVHFLAVYGFALVIPGVPGDPYCWQERQGLAILPDTSDEVRCEEHDRLMAVAREYASSYNAVIIRQLEVEVPGACAV